MKHFSHPHALHLSTIDEADEIICSGCEKYLSGYAVICTKSDCNFFLHQSCYELSRTIKHPSHPAHPLILLTNSPYEVGEFMCDGCGDQGRAFHFHCSTCRFDLDVSCALRYQPVTRGTGRVVTSTLYCWSRYGYLCFNLNDFSSLRVKSTEAEKIVQEEDTETISTLKIQKIFLNRNKVLMSLISSSF